MLKLYDIIVKVFGAFGFRVAKSSKRDKYMLLVKDKVNLAVGYKEPSESAAPPELEEFRSRAKGDNAHRCIFIAPGEFTEATAEVAEKGEVQLWDRVRLEREIGRAVLGEVEGISEPKAEDVFADVFAKELEARELPVAETGILVPVVAPTEYFKIGKVEEAEAKPAKAKVRRKKKARERPRYQILKPRVSKADASATAKKVIQGFRYDLELVPYYIYDYSCEALVEGRKETERSTGTIGINGLTGEGEEWSTHFDTVNHIKGAHTRLEPRIDEEGAFSKARELVINLNTKMIETVLDKDSATVIEKKKVKPKEDAVELTSRGMVYIPVWCIEGENGVMTIDASSGKILKEDLYKSSR
jgi:hypothetical protein